jgi:hypothetical protein
MVGRRFYVTNQEYFSLVPGNTNQGDHIALLRGGGGYPVVLRAIMSAWILLANAMSALCMESYTRLNHWKL